MKLLISLCCSLLLIGCSAKRISTNPTPITTWEQVSYDNLQISVHNRAIAKAITAANQAGLLETSYYDVVSREGINLTNLHKALTPLLKDEATARTNSEKVDLLLNQLVNSSTVIAETASIKNEQSRQNLITEAQLVRSLAGSILSLLRESGVITAGGVQ